MKKWIVFLLGFLTLTISCIYIFIPAKITLSQLGKAEVTSEGEYRNISQEDKWEKWWRDSDGKKHIRGNPFSYNGTLFQITKSGNNAVGIEIDRNGSKYPSVIHLISIGHDSIGTIWQCELPSSNNPFTRIIHYKHAAEIYRDISGVLKVLSYFVSNPQNVYGFSFFMDSFRDTTLLSTRFISPSFPTTQELYRHFDILKQNIQKQNGKISGFPMMNVEVLENGSFETQVAIPTNRQLKDDGKIVYRRMVPGNFLCSEVHGGAYTANEALKQMNFFISDNHKSKVANPFQILVTDRMTEPDTLKWITKTYIPVANNDLLNK
jgi:hypothetical protein